MHPGRGVRASILLLAICALLGAARIEAAYMAVDLGSEFLKVSVVKPGRSPFSIVVNEMCALSSIGSSINPNNWRCSYSPPPPFWRLASHRCPVSCQLKLLGTYTARRRMALAVHNTFSRFPSTHRTKRKTSAQVGFVNGERLVGEEAAALGTRFPATVYQRTRDLLGKRVDHASVRPRLPSPGHPFPAMLACTIPCLSQEIYHFQTFQTCVSEHKLKD